MRSALVVLALGLVTSLGAQGRLVFESNQQQITVNPGTREATTAFAFRVEGDAPVTIKEVKASCGCTAPTLERNTYVPGESGFIPVAYHPGSRQGRQAVRIQVMTDEPGVSSHELMLDVNIPELVTVTPRMLVWTLGGPATPRIVDVRIHPPEEREVTGLEVANDAFDVQVVEVAKGRHYRIVATPRDTASAHRAVVRWNYTGEPWAGTVPSAYLLVRGGEPEQP